MYSTAARAINCSLSDKLNCHEKDVDERRKWICGRCSASNECYFQFIASMSEMNVLVKSVKCSYIELFYNEQQQSA